jgi:hypothetical protein
MEATMAKRTRLTLLALAGAALLGGCATGPYYDNYYGYGPAYGYPAYGPAYYDYPYAGPSVGIGLGATYIDRDDRHYRRDWRGRHDHDGRRDRGPDVRPIDPGPRDRGSPPLNFDPTDHGQNSKG